MYIFAELISRAAHAFAAGCRSLEHWSIIMLRAPTITEFADMLRNMMIAMPNSLDVVQVGFAALKELSTTLPITATNGIPRRDMERPAPPMAIKGFLLPQRQGHVSLHAPNKG